MATEFKQIGDRHMLGMNLGKTYRFVFMGMDGFVRCFPSGAREVQWGGATFEFEAAIPDLRAAIEAAIK